METKCDVCGVRSKNQPPGDGCHTCLKGVMVTSACCLECGTLIASARGDVQCPNRSSCHIGTSVEWLQLKQDEKVKRLRRDLWQAENTSWAEKLLDTIVGC